MSELWIIEGRDADGDLQYWNNGYGWVEHRQDASTFNEEETQIDGYLPMGGSWVLRED